MREIIIPTPQVNKDAFRAYSHKSWEDATFRREMEWKSLSPQQYPLAVDLCAGDGSWARRLVDNGWAPQNITCIDIARTETPLIEGVNWVFWDLRNLGNELLSGFELPTEVAQLKGAFDIVCHSYGFLYRADIVEDFFARDGGYIWAQDRSNHFKK